MDAKRERLTLVRIHEGMSPGPGRAVVLPAVLQFRGRRYRLSATSRRGLVLVGDGVGPTHSKHLQVGHPPKQ